MRYVDQAQELEQLQLKRCTYYHRDGHRETREEPVLEEHLLDVYINERLTMKLVCTPQHLTELVLGRLLTEGVITGLEDVELLYICTYGSRAKVTLRDNLRRENPDYVELTPSCCTGNRILSDSFVKNRDLRPVTPIPWEPDWVFQLADRFAQGMPLHRETCATHSCFLARAGEILFQCEDIGRHNALDKVIGYALRNGIDLRECMVYSSGRIPTDMVEKTIRGGIPILCSKAAPTREAIDLAAAYGLTLIGAARSDRMKQYTP
jgi:FdhD protein